VLHWPLTGLKGGVVGRIMEGRGTKKMETGGKRNGNEGEDGREKGRGGPTPSFKT